MSGRHDSTVKTRSDATLNLNKEAGVIEDLEQVFLRDLAASSFQLHHNVERAACKPGPALTCQRQRGRTLE